jgi:hypothetical protein
MPPVVRRLALGVLLAAASACAGRPATATGTRAPRANRDEISLATMLERHYTNAWDAVEALHSNWLQTRGTDSQATPTPVWVYVDNVKLGTVERLREIAVTSIAYIRHYDGVAATSRWGVGHGQGVIQISTQPR